MSKSPSLRRIQADIRELSIDPSDQYHAAPLEHDMFEWHFTIRGASATDFEGGVYHGRILLPPEYPFKPPNIVFLTPSGRFETNTKVCLSFSSFHPELWQPAWGIRLILEALISFLPTPADGAIGALDWTKEERVKLAKESVKFRCPICCEVGKTCVDLLPELKAGKKEGKKTKFHEEIEKLKMLQFQNHAVEEGESNDDVKDNDDEVEEEAQKPAAASDIENDELVSASTTADENSTAKPSEVKNDSAEVHSTNVSATETNPVTNKTPAANNTAASIAKTPSTQAVTETDNDASLLAAVEAPLVSDRTLNGVIAVLAFVVIMLARQASELVDELKRLENWRAD
jgi:ubiquitin-conjugating enzyme E2 J1